MEKDFIKTAGLYGINVFWIVKKNFECSERIYPGKLVEYIFRIAIILDFKTLKVSS